MVNLGPVLAIDYGRRFLGIAVSDESGLIAFAYKTLDRSKIPSLEMEIRMICAQKKIKKIILGLPLNADLSEGSLAKEIREFKEKLEDFLNIPIEFIDEHLSSFKAEELLKEKKKFTRPDIDMMSAQIILQNYLDKC